MGGGYRSVMAAGRATEGATEAERDDDSDDEDEGRAGAFSVSHHAKHHTADLNHNSAEGAGANLQHGVVTARERQQQMMLMGTSLDEVQGKRRRKKKKISNHINGDGVDPPGSNRPRQVGKPMS